MSDEQHDSLTQFYALIAKSGGGGYTTPKPYSLCFTAQESTRADGSVRVFLRERLLVIERVTLHPYNAAANGPFPAGIPSLPIAPKCIHITPEDPREQPLYEIIRVGDVDYVRSGADRDILRYAEIPEPGTVAGWPEEIELRESRGASGIYIRTDVMVKRVKDKLP